MPATATTHHVQTRGRGRHPRLRATAAPILELDGVTARAPGGKVLLDDVSFSVRRGWLVAVVGPTGAGKTSLARALTGALALRAGKIRLDGQDLTGDDDLRRERIAYVPQDDMLHGQLELGRMLSYAASLRVPASLGPDERRRRVASVLGELGLEQHVDTPITLLSGGQRKRANIAAELVGQPEVLVLDEPTSGLDPGYEKSVMGTLRQLADGGRTVIAVTHSMQALSCCDRVLFLAEGGRVAYFGPPDRVADYFGRSDAADVFLALDTESGQEWKERFRAHPAYARYVTPVVEAATRVADRHHAPAAQDDRRWGSQVRTLVRRHLDLLRSDRRHLALLLLQGPLLGLLLWFVLAPDSLQLLAGAATPTPTPASETVAMFVALSATWLGASNAAREIVKERHIVRREVDAGLSPSAYVVSKAIVLGGLTMVQAAMLTLIACAAQQPPSQGALLGSGRLELVATGALVGLAAAALGLLISALVTSPDKALALLPMTLVTQLALAGGWASTLTAPGLTLLRDLTGARWGVAAINATVAGGGRDWVHAAVVLVALTTGSLVGAVLLVRRHTQPARTRVPLVARVEAVRAATLERSTALLVATAGLVLIVGLSTAVGPGDDSSAPSGVRLAHVAEAPTAVAPVIVVPPAVEQGAPVAAAPVPEPTPAPTTPAPVVQEQPTTPTTVAPEPTTTTTIYSTPTTTAPAVIPPTNTVTPASSAATSWLSPWYWIFWAASTYG